ncbi:hypothetical protein C8R43DRAFT_889479 [Mycena crocata]|nr:hypothetical protein C8R43DRAFT_889479 [Mycena crocata]
MHHCLQIPELLRIMFEGLGDAADLFDPSPYAPYTGRYPVLARLGRTCRQFSDIALDTLWREQETLVPLLKCLPSHLWELGGPDGESFCFRKGSIQVSVADWERVLLYSHRIRDMTFRRDVAPETLKLLHALAPMPCLLPNLDSAMWTRVETVVPCIGFVLGPNVASIRMPFQPTSSHSLLLSQLASNFSSSLVEVIMWTKNTSADTAAHDGSLEAVSSFVLSLNKVETLCIPFLTLQAYEHLASLPAFKSLSIDCLIDTSSGNPATESNADIANARGPAKFPSLTRLAINNASSMDSLTTLLCVLAHAPLETFSFSGTHSTSITPSRLFAALRANCSHYHLTTLHVSFWDWDSVVRGDPITPKALRPLLAFTRLRSVRLTADFSLDDDFCAEMAVAWQDIEQLDLSLFGVETNAPSAVTLSGLSSFARHCPNLQHLALPLDAMIVYEAATSAQSALAFLNVMSSPIESTAPAARFLSATFPSLRKINNLGDLWREEEHGLMTSELEAMHRKWKEVEKLALVLAAARAEDEKFWRAKLQSEKLKQMVSIATQTET